MTVRLADKIAELIGVLRHAEIPVSVAEAMDAAQAAAVAGVERSVLRDALAATLIKDEDERGVFLVAFERTFPARAADVVHAPGKRRGRRAAAGAGQEGGAESMAGGGAGATAGGTSGGPSAPGRTSPAHDGADATAGAPAPDADAPSRSATGAAVPAGAPGERDEADRLTASRAAAGHEAPSAADDSSGAALLHARRPPHLLRLPFRAMTPTDVDACADLARAIAARVTARVRRRLAPRRTGRLDFRRTIRAAIPRGGVPFERRYRSRRPGAPDLVALCDLSASTATASAFFLTLLTPAALYFRRVRLFGFVDRLIEIEFVDGQVRPAGRLDVMARSDFGRVLRDLVEGAPEILGADTVLLVLGDARNNRRPPRADLLAAARARVRRVLWLNPDPLERWNTGDSVMATYARHADAVVACGTLTDLDHALAAVTKL